MGRFPGHTCIAVLRQTTILLRSSLQNVSSSSCVPLQTVLPVELSSSLYMYVNCLPKLEFHPGLAVGDGERSMTEVGKTEYLQTQIYKYITLFDTMM